MVDSPPLDPGEQAVVRGRVEAGEMFAEQPGQFRADRHDAGVALGPVLQLPLLPRSPVIGPLIARIRRCTANMQLTPSSSSEGSCHCWLSWSHTGAARSHCLCRG